MARQKTFLLGQYNKLVENHKKNLEHRMRDGNTEDFKPVVKFFNPVGAATWLLSELDPETNVAFGLCDLGMGEPELGYVDINELMGIKLRYGMYIERDIHFEGKKPLSEYANEAYASGRISA